MHCCIHAFLICEHDRVSVDLGLGAAPFSFVPFPIVLPPCSAFLNPGGLLQIYGGLSDVGALGSIAPLHYHMAPHPFHSPDVLSLDDPQHECQHIMCHLNLGCT